MKNKFFLGILVFALVGLQSCQKSEKTDTITATASLENNLKAAVSEIVSTSVNEIGLQDVHGICMDKFDGFGDAIKIGTMGKHGMGHFKFPHMSDCATVTVNDSVYPKEIIIEYNAGCTDHSKHTISGKIIITISDTLSKVGATKTIVFQDIYIDSVNVELNASYKNLGVNADSNWVIQNIYSQKITLTDGTVLSKINQDTLEWLSGFGTTKKDDDIFLRTGSGSINMNDSLIYSRKITTPLLFDKSCEFILSGVIELYKAGTTVVIDYGDGTCDDIATVTTDGSTEEINLRSHNFSEKGEFRKHCHGFGHRGH